MLLDEVLQKLDFTERIFVLDKQYVLDGCSLPGEEKTLVSPLVVAVQNGNLDCVKLLLKYGADIEGRGAGYNNKSDFNIKGAGNLTPLMLAIDCHNFNAVNYLLQNGAHLDLEDTYGQICLRHAVCGRDETSYEILCSLIKNGADVNARIGKINTNQTLLMLATKFCFTFKKVTLLIKNGANLDLQDQSGNTALHYALYSHNTFVVLALLNAGASQLCNSQGLMPLLLASNNGDAPMVKCVIKHRPEMTKEQRIDALELLGASLCLGHLDHLMLTFRDIRKDSGTSNKA